MLIGLTLIILVVLVAVAVILKNTTSGFLDAIRFTIIFLAVLVFAALIIMNIVMAVNYIGLDGQIATNNARYESLVYQLENDIYDNDNDLGKRELYVDIQEWNEDLAYYKETQDDFWIGVFIPDVYDQFEFIEME